MEWLWLILAFVAGVVATLVVIFVVVALAIVNDGPEYPAGVDKPVTKL